MEFGLRPTVLFVALALLVAACSGSSGASKTPSPALTTTSAAEGTPATSATRAAKATAASTATPLASTAVAPTATIAESAPSPAAPASIPATGEPGSAPSVVVGSISGATMQYYDITGTTVGELRASMDALGPVDSAGRRNDAFTMWNIDWTWPLNPDSSCVLSGATITTAITVTFPRWLPPAGAPPSLIERWNTYQAAIVTHESGHVNYVVTAANDVLAAIKGATCTTAEAAAQAVVARIRQHDLDYDAETNHGFAQGAHFP